MIHNWKTIPVATFTSMEEILQALVETGIVLGWKAGQLCNKIAGHITLPTEPVNVSVVTNADLGINGSVCVHDFYRKALAKGYKLFTPELGILARLAYKPDEQIKNQDLWWIAIAMEPVEVDGESLILRITAGTKGPRLDAVETTGSEAFMSDPQDKWLLISP